MVKVLVIENRMASEVFNKLVCAIEQIKVGWFVINPYFFNSSFRSDYVYEVNHKNSKDDKQEYPNGLDMKSLSRSLRYYNIKVNYPSYNEQVCDCLDKFNPDIVIGECTQFYEILMIDECIRRKILYLNPVVTRYPKNRIEFYLYDTDFVIKHRNQKQKISEGDIDNIIHGISAGKIVPSYIDNLQHRKSKIFKLFESNIIYYAKILLSSIYVENSVTPNIFVKSKIYLQTMFYNRHIDLSDYKSVATRNKFFLYAMQLQPENNIDIFGIRFSDQSSLIYELAVFLKKHDINLVVKLNPIRKYQINRNLVRVSKSVENLYFVDGSAPMKYLMDNSMAVCTVTGTVLIEAVSRNKPVFSFAKTRMAQLCNVPVLNSINDLNNYINDGVLNDQFVQEYDIANYIRDVDITSYDAAIYNPVGDVHFHNDKSNDMKLAKAFEDIIDNYDDLYYDTIANPGSNLLRNK